MSNTPKVVADHMHAYYKGQRTLLDILINNGTFTLEQVGLFHELLDIVNYSDSEL